MRALQVDRLQRKRDLAAAETGEDREAQRELCKWTGSRGGGTWQLLKLGRRHNESSASGQAPEEEGPGRHQVYLVATEVQRKRVGAPPGAMPI